MTPVISSSATVLFQGDSITDCGRDRANDSNLGSGYPAMVAAWFAARQPAARVRNELGALLVILEPFVLPVPADRVAWRDDLDPKIQAARRVAADFGAVYVPLDGMFARAAAQRDAAFWAGDGVHPSPAGHARIAQAWLEAVGTA